MTQADRFDWPGMIPGSYLKTTVKDTGLGMGKEVLDKIFEPFFTTKPASEGTGMGLAVVHGIVKSHHGDIRCFSTPGAGTWFEILLPLHAEASMGDMPEAAPLVRGTGRILFVDDEAGIVDLHKQTLENLGYEVVSRTSSRDALEAFRANPDRFDLVITDMTMPHMTGVTLSSLLQGIRSDIPIILCTGFSDQITPEKARELGIRTLLTKPVSIQDLGEAIRKALPSSDQ